MPGFYDTAIPEDYWPGNANLALNYADEPVVHIYQPAPSVTQSGRARQSWIMEYDVPEKLPVDPLMGWTGCSDTRSQIRVNFPNRESAVFFVERQKLPYEIRGPYRQLHRPKQYVSNFRRT